MTVRVKPPATARPSRLIAAVRGLALLGALSLLTVPLLFWLQPAWVAQAAPQIAGVDSAAVSVTSDARLAGAALSALLVAVGLCALWFLWRLFGEYAAGRALGLAAQQYLARFAVCMLASAIAQPLVRAAMSTVLTMGNPPGQRLLVIGLSWNDYLFLLLGLVLLAVAHVMVDAVRAADENAGFV
jgi:Protein of unknown function (DUF2975)